MKSSAYHEAGHVVAARHMGFEVESATIEEGVSPLRATKTMSFGDYFDEDELMLGRLVRKGGNAAVRHDYKIFYSFLILKLAGSIAVEMAGISDSSDLAVHFNEDRAFVRNTLRLLDTQGIEHKFEQIERIASKLLKNRWSEVESLAKRLLVEKTVFFD